MQEACGAVPGPGPKGRVQIVDPDNPLIRGHYDSPGFPSQESRMTVMTRTQFEYTRDIDLCLYRNDAEE